MNPSAWLRRHGITEPPPRRRRRSDVPIHPSDDSSTDSLTDSEATSMKTTLSKPPAPATPMPYGTIEEALDDLAREFQAQLSLVRRLRERNGGLPGKGLGNFRHLTLPDGWIAPLAQGATLREGTREWTLALLACHGELPVETWRALRDACREWRTGRLGCSPEGFPLRQLSAIESQLDPLVASLVCCDLIRASGNDLNQILVRCTYDHASNLDLGALANLLGEDRGSRRRCDFRGLFGRDSLVVRLGIYDHPGADDEGLPPEDWTPHLCRPLVAQLLGQAIDHLGNEPGVTILRPTERLADVVLTGAQARLVRTIDLGWSARPGATNALGVLLHGPSGTGKTMVVKALAGEAGMPVILVDGQRRRHDDEEDNDAFLAGLLRRAAAERAVLFIDEADDVLPDKSASSRSLLMALERFPAVVFLATNQPLLFDPALDRRLQIKIHMDLPGPTERADILRLELARQRVPLAAGLTNDPQVSRLAESVLLSGGHLRNVIQVAVMMASQRSGAVGEPVQLDDLTEAVRLQIAGEQVVDLMRSTTLRWVEHPRPFGQRPLGVKRSREAAALVVALESVRSERAAADRPGLGVLVVITGPERRLGEESAEGLASALRLPLARLGEKERAGVRASSAEMSDNSWRTRGASGFRDMLAASRRRRSESEEDDDGHDTDERTPPRWSDREISDCLADLGETAAVHLALTAKCLDQAMDLVDALATTPHLTVVHVVGGAAPAWIRRRAAVVLPWAVVDRDTRILRWDALGGQGEPPAGHDLADLAAAAARGHLARCGWSGTGSDPVLP